VLVKCRDRNHKEAGLDHILMATDYLRCWASSVAPSIVSSP
jgi:hypothetical protein